MTAADIVYVGVAFAEAVASYRAGGYTAAAIWALLRSDVAVVHGRVVRGQEAAACSIVDMQHKGKEEGIAALDADRYGTLGAGRAVVEKAALVRHEAGWAACSGS